MDESALICAFVVPKLPVVFKFDCQLEGTCVKLGLPSSPPLPPQPPPPPPLPYCEMESHKKQALLLMFLSSITGLTGNFLLASVGMLCGGMHYCNNGSAPDLMFMLSFMTAVVGLMYLFSVISFGTLMLFVSPERVCGVSTSLMERVSSEKAELPTNAGYWNMTETAQGHIAYHTRSSPTAVKGLEHGEFSLMSCPSSPSPWPALFNCVHACAIHL